MRPLRFARFRRGFLAALLVSLASGALPSAGWGQAHAPAALRITDAPHMLDCNPVTPAPCFFLTFTPVDAEGRPAPVALPPRDALLRDTSMQIDGAAVAPFYVSTGIGPAGTLKRGVVLIAVDTSGSMKEPSAGAASRFDAAREAIADYLATMREGVDEVAIVPFNGQGVVPTIQAAVFSSRRADLRAQLAALPQPGGNTALYQAVFTGVQTLEREVKTLRGEEQGDLDPKLIVMTDGKNEVLRGDDGGLLTGALGLGQAAAKVQASHLPVIGIGFGKPEAIDLPALTELSTRHFLAQNKTELEQVFRATETLYPGQITAGFLSPWMDRAALAAADLRITARLQLPGGPVLESDDGAWHAVAVGNPAFRGHAPADAVEALIRRGPPPLAAWNTLLRAVLVFAGFAVLLLLLWFWVPRLVWAEGAGEPIPGDRWGRGDGRSTGGAGSRQGKAPAGFAPGGKTSVQVRSAAQVTQVRHRSEFSQTRRIVDESGKS